MAREPSDWNNRCNNSVEKCEDKKKFLKPTSGLVQKNDLYVPRTHSGTLCTAPPADNNIITKSGSDNEAPWEMY